MPLLLPQRDAVNCRRVNAFILVKVIRLPRFSNKKGEDKIDEIFEYQIPSKFSVYLFSDVSR